MALVEVKLPEMNLPESTVAFFQRVLGPFAEAGDFLSDKIRFYRYQSSLKMMKRAQEIAEAHGIEPKEVPLKTLIPLLEKSSLEPENSELIERWAMLLAQASSDPQAVNATYVEILSRLTPEDVRCLEQVVTPELKRRLDEPSEIENKSELDFIRLLAIQDTVHEDIRKEIKSISSSGTKSEYYEKLMQRVFVFVCHQEEDSVIIETIGVNFYEFREDDIFARNRNFPDLQSLDVLISCGLIDRKHYRYDVGDGEAYVTLILPTVFGLWFLAACRGDGLPRPPHQKGR